MFMNAHFIDWIIFCVAYESVDFFAEYSVFPQIGFGGGVVAFKYWRVVGWAFESIGHQTQCRDWQVLIQISLKHLYSFFG